MSSLQADYEPRPRLTSQLTEARLGLVWAAGGYGKSALAAELREVLGVTALSVRLSPADRDPGCLAVRVRAELRRTRRSDALAAMEEAGGGDAELAFRALAAALNEEPDPLLVVFDDPSRQPGGRPLCWPTSPPRRSPS